MDGRGVPLSIVVTGANRHDVSQLQVVLERRVMRSDENSGLAKENLCADAGYAGRAPATAMQKAGYVPHVRSRGEEHREKRRAPGWKARRWVVEASHSWFNRFRKLLVRFEKTHASYMALTHLAAAIIALRKVMTICG